MPKLIDHAYMRDKSDNVHTGQALWLALTIHTKKQPIKRRKNNVRTGAQRSTGN